MSKRETQDRLESSLFLMQFDNYSDSISLCLNHILFLNSIPKIILVQSFLQSTFLVHFNSFKFFLIFSPFSYYQKEIEENIEFLYKLKHMHCNVEEH